MTPDQFAAWVSAMIASGRAKNLSDCARQLGYEPKNIGRQVHAGGDHRLALACAALLAGIVPYGASADSTPETQKARPPA